LVNRNCILYRYCSEEFDVMTSLYYLYRDLLVVMKILSQLKYNSNRMLVVQN
jgi:hypothetical protein